MTFRSSLLECSPPSCRTVSYASKREKRGRSTFFAIRKRERKKKMVRATLSSDFVSASSSVAPLNAASTRWCGGLQCRIAGCWVL